MVVSDVATPVGGVTYDTDLEETVRLVEAAGGQAIQAFADVRDVGMLRDAVAAGVSAFGGLDNVVANAGVASWPETTWLATEE